MYENLFSYGTLRYQQVQLDTFGRELDGSDDTLMGYRIEQVEITDPAVLASSGERFHPILRASNQPDEKVEGTVLKVTPEELMQADAYEVDDYTRVSVTLVSGTQAWVYVEAGAKTQ